MHRRREADPPAQLAEVVRRFDLTGAIDLVVKEAIQDRLLLKTRRCDDEFATCHEYGRIYWQGFHYDYDDMQRPLERLLGRGAEVAKATTTEDEAGSGPPMSRSSRRRVNVDRHVELSPTLRQVAAGEPLDTIIGYLSAVRSLLGRFSGPISSPSARNRPRSEAQRTGATR